AAVKGKAFDRKLKSEWAALDLSSKLYYCQRADCFPDKRKLDFIRQCRFHAASSSTSENYDLDFERKPCGTPKAAPGKAASSASTSASASSAAATAASGIGRYQPIRPRLLPPFQSLLSRRVASDPAGSSSVDDSVQLIGIEYPPAAKRPRVAASSTVRPPPLLPASSATSTPSSANSTAAFQLPLPPQQQQQQQQQPIALSLPVPHYCAYNSHPGFNNNCSLQISPPSIQPPPPPPPQFQQPRYQQQQQSVYNSYWQFYYSAYCANQQQQQQQQQQQLPQQSMPSYYDQARYYQHPYQQQHRPVAYTAYTAPSPAGYYGRRDVASQFPSATPPPPPSLPQPRLRPR
ncbi:hypothetical protein BOX15_Mlig019161g2, partial [Macrostomum lignano]